MTNESILAERYESLALLVDDAEYGITLLKKYVARYANDNDATTAKDKAHVLESLAFGVMLDVEQIRLDIDRLVRVLQGQNQ